MQATWRRRSTRRCCTGRRRTRRCSRCTTRLCECSQCRGRRRRRASTGNRTPPSRGTGVHRDQARQGARRVRHVRCGGHVRQRAGNIADPAAPTRPNKHQPAGEVARRRCWQTVNWPNQKSRQIHVVLARVAVVIAVVVAVARARAVDRSLIFSVLFVPFVHCDNLGIA